MKTVTVEIKNDIALIFLHNLESLNILREIENKTDPVKLKLSERFTGCLSKERTEELQKELIQMRNEWERDIYYIPIQYWITWATSCRNYAKQT